MKRKSIIQFLAVSSFLFLQQSLAQTVDELMSEINASSSALLGVDNNAVRGQLRPINFTIISSGLDAKLTNFPVRTGNRVSQGDIIAEFNCNVERANSDIAKSQENSAEKSLTINRRLSQLNNIGELELSLSESEFDIAQAELSRANSILSECVVRAPFSGTVTEKYVEAYQYVSKGELLIELVDTRNLEVEMVLPSLNLSQYQAGQSFMFVIDETGQTVSARIDRVVNVIDPVSQTIRVIGTLDNTADDLMPGMSGVVVFSE